mgnify:FL=1
MEFKVCKNLEYVRGYLKYGHGEVIVNAESEEEALAIAEEAFENDGYNIEVDDYEIEDCGNFYGKAYIK